MQTTIAIGWASWVLVLSACFPGPLAVEDGRDADSIDDATAVSDTALVDVTAHTDATADSDADSEVEAPTDAATEVDADVGGDVDASAMDGADATTPECDDDLDCHALDGICVLGRCDDGTCVAALDTGSACDDGDPCVAGDACASGVCAGTRVPNDAPGDRAVGFSATKAVIVMGGAADLDGDDLLLLQVEGAELIRDDPEHPLRYAMPEGALYTLVLVELRGGSLEPRHVVPLLYTNEEGHYIEATRGMAVLSDGSVVLGGGFAGSFRVVATGEVRGASPSGFAIDDGVFALRASRAGEPLWLREYVGAFAEVDEIQVPGVQTVDATHVAVAFTVVPGGLLEEVEDGVSATTTPPRDFGYSRVDVMDLFGERTTAVTARGDDGGLAYVSGFLPRPGGGWVVTGLSEGGATTLTKDSLDAEGAVIATGVSQGLEAWVANLGASAELETFRHFFSTALDHPSVTPWAMALRGTHLTLGLTVTGGLSSRGPDAVVSETDLAVSTRGVLLELDESDKIVYRIDTSAFADVFALAPLGGDGLVATFLFAAQLELPTSDGTLTLSETDDGQLAVATFGHGLQATSLARLVAPIAPGQSTYTFGTALPMPVWVGRARSIHVAGTYEPPATPGATALAPPATGQAAAFELVLNSDGALECTTAAP